MTGKEREPLNTLRETLVSLPVQVGGSSQAQSHQRIFVTHMLAIRLEKVGKIQFVM